MQNYTYMKDLIAEWRAEITTIEGHIERFESGEMHLYANNVDVSPQHVAMLRQSIKNLEAGIARGESYLRGE